MSRDIKELQIAEIAVGEYRSGQGALDAVTYYQDKPAWWSIAGKKISIRELQERIKQYARTKCT